MANATQIQTKVLDAIRKVGADATFAIVTGGTYSPTTGVVTGSTTTNVSAKVSPPVNYRTFYRQQDSSMKEGVSVVILPAKNLTFTPKVGMTFTIGSEKWTISAQSEHRFKSTVIAYELEVTLG